MGDLILGIILLIALLDGWYHQTFGLIWWHYHRCVFSKKANPPVAAQHSAQI